MPFRVVPILCLNLKYHFRRMLQSAYSSAWLLKMVIKKI